MSVLIFFKWRSCKFSWKNEETQITAFFFTCHLQHGRP